MNRFPISLLAIIAATSPLHIHANTPNKIDVEKADSDARKWSELTVAGILASLAAAIAAPFAFKQFLTPTMLRCGTTHHNDPIANLSAESRKRRSPLFCRLIKEALSA